jgi:hypothetical protein
LAIWAVAGTIIRDRPGGGSTAGYLIDPQLLLVSMHDPD